MDMELIMGVVKIIAFVLLAIPLMAVVAIASMLFVLAFGMVCHLVLKGIRSRRRK